MEEERSDAYEKQRRNSTAGITSCPRSSPFWKEGCDLFSSLGSEPESRQIEAAVRIFQASLELFIQDAHFNDRHLTAVTSAKKERCELLGCLASDSIPYAAIAL